METKLTRQIVESYNFPNEVRRVCKADFIKEYTLPNGFKVYEYTIMFGEPYAFQSLTIDCDYPFDEIQLTTKEQLETFMNKSIEQIHKDILK